MPILAVIFDLGGVVLGSPLHAIAQYERELGLPPNFVNRVVADTAPGGAWSRLERGELAMEEFYTAFELDCRDAGQTLSAREMMARMALEARPRAVMLAAIGKLRRAGLRVGALTNNWAHGEDADQAGASAPSDGTRALVGHFDVFVESSVEGLRKPDPRIYQLTCERLGVAPAESAFLDDIGSNLKSARALGMSTIKVDEPESALAALSELVGISLLD